MSELVLERVWSPPLKSVSVTFGPGLHVVLGSDADGSADLIELCAGVRQPRRGSLRLDGEAPDSSPTARRSIGSLLAQERWYGAGELGRFAGELGALHGIDAAAALELFCPSFEPRRSVSSLSAAARREIALGLALSLPEPKLVALYEPLAAAPATRYEHVLERIAALAERVPVLIATASVADAQRIGGRLQLLERGVLVREPPSAWPNAVTPWLQVQVSVECRAPRRLASALANAEEITQTELDVARGRVRVAGTDLERVVGAVARAAADTGVELTAIAVEAPDLSSVHAASAGLAEAAYRAAQSGRGGSFQRPPRRADR